MPEKNTEELIIEAKGFFSTYKQEIGESIRRGKKVVFISFNDLASHSPVLAEALISSPEEILQILETSLEETGLIKNPRIRLDNLPETQRVKIRTIRAEHLNQLIYFEGLVRQASDVRPQVVNAKFECPSCGTVISVLQIDRKFREPSRCSCGRKGQFRLISKAMVDAQRLVIEESPESLSGGEQPRRISVFLKEDLVEPVMEEKTTPGSKVRVLGILKEVPIPLQTGAISTRFDLAVEANNLIPLESSYEELEISDEEERQIQELSTDPELFKRLRNSIAPSIWGYEEIKEALVLQMFSGVRKVNPNDGSVSRGDIHLFLMGDPGVAKSQVLKFVSNIAPRGRYVVGMGASGRGLTATVVRDEFLKGWSLEAGAMVLANKGVVCIDEIEKMGAEDRSAMHEALEQQCYHHNTVVTLADGSERKIGELVEELLDKNKEKIISGKDCLILPIEDLEVLTTDFKNIYKTKINRISKHKAFDKFIKIKFSNGREITVTPEHPVFTAENAKIITKRADLIKIGDSIPIPLIIPIAGEQQKFNTDIKNIRAIQHINIPKNNCKEIFKIAGYFIAEGSREINRKKLIGINFTNKDQRLLNDFENLMRLVFNLSPYKQARIDEHEVRYMYRYTSRELAEFLIRNMPEIMKTSGEKQIPQVLMKGEKQNIAQMLSAMFEGDGHVSVKKRTIRIGYSTKSRRLAEQVQDLLLRFGIRSNLNEDREYFKVLITGYDNIKRFLEKVSFITPEKNKVIELYLKEKTIKRTVKDIIPKEFNEKIIKIIKEEGIMQVEKYKQYDIIYDHSIRKDRFSFSRQLIISLLKQVKKQENIEFLESFTKDIGWEKVVGIEIIKNENENWVYDITIEPNHAFVSQGSILHNTVTISKANIQASLTAQTSVLAAGNPKYGRFEPLQPIAQQIDLPPALINRFDLIFILRDLPNKRQDDAIATHVLKLHQLKGEKSDIDRELFRKYVAYAKQKINPELTDEAVEEIKNFYVKLRNMQSSGDSSSIPISARQLQALVRLAEAHAKTRLSNKVKREDSQVAIRLMNYYLMQVGYDAETKTFDIDRFTTHISSSQRSKIILVKETIRKLEEQHGKMVPLDILRAELGTNITEIEFDEAIQKLKSSGDVFQPKLGFVQLI
ncbi:MAG: LAGLIDADG family homing endonuclease [Candidatus Nanoarchaeia archaeon]|nr:LAGLIDADG family homing endonuclease [Candidatus Nanoarchaeia archaeon]